MGQAAVRAARGCRQQRHCTRGKCEAGGGVLATVREIKRKDAIVRLQQRSVDSHVRRGAWQHRPCEWGGGGDDGAALAPPQRGAGRT